MSDDPTDYPTNGPDEDEFIDQAEVLRDELMLFLRERFDRVNPTSKDVEEHLAAVYTTLQFQASVYFSLLGRPQKTFLSLAKRSLHAAKKECDERREKYEAVKRGTN
jgi:hypothetical protein